MTEDKQTEDKATEGAAFSSAEASALGYRVLCISMYDRDISVLDACVRELKRRGIKRANRSWLIRLALGRLDIESIGHGERP